MKVTFKDAGNAGAADVVADRLAPAPRCHVIKIVNKEFERDMASPKASTLDKVMRGAPDDCAQLHGHAALRVLNYLSVVEAARTRSKNFLARWR